MSSLELRERRFGDVVVISPVGRLVPDQEDLIFREWIDRLIDQGICRIVVDLHDVVLLDSGGIGVLIAKLHSVRKRGGDLRLAHLTPRTERLLAITHLLAIFMTFASVDAAVQSFGVQVPAARSSS
jgi:anti-anti-sigma factor